jgi:Protein of unknown function (DUF1622)
MSYRTNRAADVVRTVVLERTLQNVMILGLLVVIRTFLSWSLVVEIEGHWPWRGIKSDGGRSVEGKPVSQSGLERFCAYQKARQ